MINVLRKNLPSLVTFFLFLIIGLVVLGFTDKINLQIFINQFYHPIGNQIFLFFTHMAEGWLTIPLLAGMLIYNWRKGLYIGIVYAISSLFVYLFKFHVFDIINRPFGTKALNKLSSYHWLPDVKMPVQMSFPSGHTTTGFAIFMALALITKNKKLGVVFILIACLIGFSRTYLSYHFFTDVLAGSFLGTFTAYLIYFIFRKPLKLEA